MLYACVYKHALRIRNAWKYIHGRLAKTRLSSESSIVALAYATLRGIAGS